MVLSNESDSALVISNSEDSIKTSSQSTDSSAPESSEQTELLKVKDKFIFSV